MIKKFNYIAKIYDKKCSINLPETKLFFHVQCRSFGLIVHLSCNFLEKWIYSVLGHCTSHFRL